MVKGALLAAIRADPDDDEARRVYADALIAEGDPRGEVIALQLAHREADLAPFTPTLRRFGPASRWRWDRGFICGLDITVSEDTIGLLREMFATELIVDLTIAGDPLAMKTALALRELEQVRRLGVFADAGDIAGAKWLGNVRELRVGKVIGDGGLASLADANFLVSVTHLALGPLISQVGLRALGESTLGERLEILELHGDEITAHMAEQIIAMPSLHTFAYSRGYVDHDAMPLLIEHFGKRAVVCDDDSTNVIWSGAERVRALIG